jgi:glycerol-3-phosphate acyltransferase PlsY
VTLALLILFTHRSNIGRLIRGEENRFERVRIFRRR